jgi:hypothetical protein
MKKALLLSLVMVLGASVAVAQPGAIGTFADMQALDCNVVDAAAGLLDIWVVHVLTGGSTGNEFSSPVPACMVGASYLAWAPEFGVAIGNPVIGGGTSTGYGACLVGPIAVGKISFFGGGLSQPCCEYPILPNANTGQLVSVDCVPQAVPATGLSNTVNGNETCDCATVPTHDATWGKVKSLYQ